MKAMILAAGRGSRMRPLTDTTPKPLIEVGGMPLIERHILGLREAGIVDMVINLGWLGERLRESLGDGVRFGVRLVYSEEGWPALETGGGVFRALPLLGGEPFLVVSADIWSDYPIAQLVARADALPANDLAHLVMVPNSKQHPRGDFAVDAGRVRNSPPEFTFANFSVLRPQLFDGCIEGPFQIAPLWRTAADAGRVGGEVYRGRWWNVGTPEQISEIDAIIRNKKQGQRSMG